MMTMPRIDSRQTAQAIARLAHCMRRDWDETGVIAVLREVYTEPIDRVLVAVVGAARDPQARTPKAITWAQYWPTDRPGELPPEPVCLVCNATKPRHDRMDALIPEGDTHHDWTPSHEQEAEQ